MRVVRVGALMILMLLSGRGLLGQPPCSLQTVVGQYATLGQGTIFITVPESPAPIPVPGINLGVASVDYKGRGTGTFVAIFGGQLLEGEVAGNFKVNPDCTAVLTYSITPKGAPEPLPGVGIVQLVIKDGGNEMSGIPTQVPLGQPVWIDKYKRISRGPANLYSAGCSTSQIRGTYAYEGAGIVLVSVPSGPGPVPVPAAIVGRAAVDHRGRMYGPGTTSIGGQIAEFELVDAEAQVNPDCTGTAAWSLQLKGSDSPLPGQGMDRFVVLNGGDELWSVTVQGLGGQPIGLTTYKRISRVPLPAGQ